MTTPLVICKDQARLHPARTVRHLEFEGAPTALKPPGITYQPQMATVYSSPDLPPEEWVVVLVGQRLKGTYNTKKPITDTLVLSLAPEWLRAHILSAPGVTVPTPSMATRLGARR